jgi:hypothetical protein
LKPDHLMKYIPVGAILIICDFDLLHVLNV